VTSEDEFDRQVSTHLLLGYPEAAGISHAAWRERCEPLREKALAHLAQADDRVPFVLVVAPSLVSIHAMIERIEVKGRKGFTEESPEDLASFMAIEQVTVPRREIYLLADVDTGRESLGMRPDDALPGVLGEGRTPLTLVEGLAVITQFPDVLSTHNAYQLMGSRCGDRRVTAVWMSKGRPRLGWCWAGNHHTWLGMATAAARVS
jgi:hypothetical protein